MIELRFDAHRMARAAYLGLRTLLFPLLLLATLLLWIAAYQTKAAYTVDLGGLRDDAFVQGFHSKEKTPELTYRWSTGQAVVDLPGIGNQPVNLSVRATGYRLAGGPPNVKLEVRGQTFEMQTAPEPRTYTFFVDRGDQWQGDFRLTFSSPTFKPPGDARELGVLVDSITVEPARYGIRPFVIPPVWALGALLIGLVLAYFCLIVTLQSRRVSLAVAAVLALVVATLLIYARPEVGLLARGLPGLMAWTFVVSVAARLLLDFTLRNSSYTGMRLTAALGSLSAALAFLLRFGGMTYPQFLTSDLLLHVHYVQRVMRGDLLITGLLPDGTPVPYPPALYVLVAPLAAVFGSSDEAIGLVLKWLISGLDASTCLALALVGARLLGKSAGGLAALAYALSPAPFELMSAGNYSNLFAQAVFNLTLLGGLAYLGSRSSKTMTAQLALLTVGFFLTALGHYGMMLSALAIIGLFALLSVWSLFRRRDVGASLLLLASFGAAMVGGILVFYANFAGEIGSQFGALFQRIFGGRISDRPPSTPAQAVEVESLLQRFGRKLGTLIGMIPLLAGSWGVLLLGRISPQARSLLIAWLGASAFFFFLDQTLGDAIRWHYLAAAPLSLLAGRYFGVLAARGRLARTLVAACFAVILLHLLYIWVGDLIFTRYH